MLNEKIENTIYNIRSIIEDDKTYINDVSFLTGDNESQSIIELINSIKIDLDNFKTEIINMIENNNLSKNDVIDYLNNNEEDEIKNINNSCDGLLSYFEETVHKDIESELRKLESSILWSEIE